ncbi:MAG TPA: alpha/beta hydrolase [Alphaproteobacteria bacterium]|nr:alpha/beta hydrolase [Alphaproteobacteria bacterium]
MTWAGVETIRVAANGINFEVATTRQRERLALCLHGFPEHAYSWRYQMPLLARLGYRVWAPNLRGYGGTDSPREVSAYRLVTLVQDVVGLIQASGAREVLLLAHDWGAALAWILAMQQPQLIQRLVIINLPHPACFRRELRRPVQFLKSWYMWFFQLPVLPEFVLGLGSGRMIASTIRKTSRNPSRFPDEVIEVYRQNAARPGGLTAMLNWYRAAFTRGGKRRLVRRASAKIEIPTLFLWGDADVALSLRTTRGTEDYVSNLTFRILHGVSHWAQQEAPEAVNTMLEAWLAGARVPEYAELVARH